MTGHAPEVTPEQESRELREAIKALTHEECVHALAYLAGWTPAGTRCALEDATLGRRP